LQLKKLSLSNFRNLSDSLLLFNENVTFIVGDNGQGKTNLLEAIYLLGQGKSFRTAQNANLVDWSKPTKKAVVEAALSTTDGQKVVRYEVQANRRHVYLNENKIKRAKDFFGLLPLVEFSPDDLELIKGAPAVRRAYLDKILSQIDSAYVESYSNYERAIKQRNSILREAKQFQQGLTNLLVSKLIPWEEQLARYAGVIANKRAQLVEGLYPLTAEFYQHISENSQEEVTLSYESDFLSKSATALEGLFEASREQDLRFGYTNVGIQKDDVTVRLLIRGESQDARAAASQGQARSIAIGMKLAALEMVASRHQDAPIVLLDVDSELDSGRLSRLYERIYSSRYQVFISTTEIRKEALQGGTEYEKFAVKNGLINKH